MENNSSGLHQLQSFLEGLKKTEKDLNKMNAGLTSSLGSSFDKIIREHTYESEKKMKINKKSALVSLAKDGSIKIVFDNPKDGKDFFEGKK